MKDPLTSTDVWGNPDVDFYTGRESELDEDTPYEDNPDNQGNDDWD